MGKKFAVFDVDGTLTRTSLLQLIARELVARGHLGVGPWYQVETYLHDFRQKVSDESFPDYQEKAADLIFAHLKTLPVNAYQDVVTSVAKRSPSHTYVYTRELVKNLKSHGFILIAISSSEMRAVDIFTREMGFDLSVGGMFFKGDETIGGDIQRLKKGKDEILQALITKYDLDLKGSMAVGGTSSDIPLLKMVDQAIAFNPNQALFKAASENDWMVVVERKDVVYGLQKDGSTYELKQTNA